MTKGDYKIALAAIIDAAVPGDDSTVLTDENKKKLCNEVTNYHVDTVNPDKKTYPTVRF